MKEYWVIDERYGDLLNAFNDAVLVNPLINGKAGKFIEVNDVACTRLGYSREELLTLSPSDIDAERMTPGREDALRMLAQTGRYVFEMVHVGKDGKQIPVEISSRVFQKDGKDYVFSIARDISDRKRIEDELQESQTLLETIIENSPYSMWVSDEKGVMLRMNQACRDLLHVTDEDVVGKYNVLEDEIVKQQGFMHLVERVFEKGEKVQFPLEYDCSYLHKKPHPESLQLILEVTISPILNNRKKVIHAIIQHRDITERVQAERALQESEAVLRSILDATPAGVGMLINRRFIKVNNSLCKITGYSEEELLNQFTKILYPNDEEYERIGKYLYGEMERKGLGEMEARLRRKDGSEIDVLLCLTPFDPHDLSAGVCETVLDITGRKRAEEIIRLDEERLQALLKLNLMIDASESELTHFAMEEAVRLTGSNIGYIAFANEDESILTMYAWSSTAMRECAVTDKPIEYLVTDTGLWGEAIRQRRAVITNDYSAPNPLKKGYPEGHVHVTRHMNTPIFDGERIVIVAGVGNKPTEYTDGDLHQLTLLMSGLWIIIRRKRAEKEMQESEKRFRLFTELAPVGIAITDSEEKRLYLSRKFVEMLGYDENDISSVEDWWPLAYPDPALREQAHSEWMEILNKVKKSGGEAPIFDHPVTCKDGRVRQIEFRIATTGDLNFIVFTDITERKKAEEALEKTQFAMDRASDSILWVGEDGNITYANNAACSSMGYSREELLTMKVFEIDPDFPLSGWEQHKQDLKRLGTMSFESRHKTKDGHLFPVEVRSNYFEYKGHFMAYASDRDITLRKRAEEEQEKLREQLNQAQKMESVGRLAGGVAHDFNNMLGVILGHTELALDQLNPEQPLFTDLQEIRKAAERSASLTRQLLAFARQQTVTPRVLDLNDTVEGMLKMLRSLIGEDIHLAWLPGAGLWPVKVDPSQIDQILANLCVNARDAISGMGKITIETQMVTFDEAYCASHEGFVPGEYVLMSISDNGCGMDQETLSKIFEPFFTTKGIGQGTGLGLATVYGIVKQNNGFINVYSELGLGTVFKVYLPRHETMTRPEKEESTTALTEKGNETILLVEDESAILDIARMILERLGYQVLATSTPSMAINMAKEHDGKIHLLITDVVMPEMNGRDLASQLQLLHPDIQTLFMSGYTANVIAHSGVLDDGVSFIQKPFTMSDLASKVREALKAGDNPLE